jgi:type II secretory pathway predicted ATPase ExeA/septal ring-binding cell division protein DamX
MYYSHFGLSEPPFRITPNTAFFFGGGNRGAILEAMIYAVTQGEGMVKVTGEVGSGKTMLCNMLQARLPANVETVYLAHPNVPPEEILHAIGYELQLGIARDASRLEATHALQSHLLKRHAEDRRVVVFVEETQSMPLATLEEIRLLSNLETGHDKLLQIVLFGQPELDDNLRQPAIRQLRERITHSFRLEPLTVPEIHEYLMFRLRTAGYRGPDLFSTRVVKRIARSSQGLTRRVNLIADKALLAAFAENTHTIRTRHINAAVRDSEFSRGSASQRGRPQAAAGAALVLVAAAVAGAVLLWGVPGMRSDSSAERPLAPLSAKGHAPGTEAIPALEPSHITEPGGPPGAVGDSARPEIAPTASRSESTDARNAAEPGAPSGASLVEARLAATRNWLARVDPDAFTIQLMEAEHAPQLVRDLKEIAKSIEINDVFLYRIDANRKASLAVLYGSFNDRRVAQDALDKLPPALKANRPFLRTVRGMRGEMGRRAS